ncbi:MAG: hypothetical protein KC486_36575 [Myxococcales bacterium]|nr:hypothetical protein [Myxococcales bacterium]
MSTDTPCPAADLNPAAPPPSIQDELRECVGDDAFPKIGGVFLGWALGSAAADKPSFEARFEAIERGDLSSFDAAEDKLGALLFLRLVPADVREGTIEAFRGELPLLLDTLLHARRAGAAIQPIDEPEARLWLVDVSGERLLLEASSAEIAAARAKEARPDAVQIVVRPAFIGEPEVFDAADLWTRIGVIDADGAPLVQIASHRELLDDDGCSVQVLREADDGGAIYGFMFEADDDTGIVEGIALPVRNGCSAGVTVAAIRAVLEDLEDLEGPPPDDPAKDETPCP